MPHTEPEEMQKAAALMLRFSLHGAQCSGAPQLGVQQPKIQLYFTAVPLALQRDISEQRDVLISLPVRNQHETRADGAVLSSCVGPALRRAVCSRRLSWEGSAAPWCNTAPSQPDSSCLSFC